MRVQVEKQKAWCYCWSEAGKMLSKVSEGCQESWAERKLSCEQCVRWSSLQFFTKRRLSERESLQLTLGWGLQQPSRGYQESWAGSKFSSRQRLWGLFYCFAGK